MRREKELEHSMRQWRWLLFDIHFEKEKEKNFGGVGKKGGPARRLSLALSMS
jgi:hypothetical protein